ncbi:PKD repeat protein [Kribbella voronezhensis]|uniref:PKD repeat protein n=1 Tax=Kribbella voronezhensis TaxID=2512212 RepID=A0A4R7SZ02_9ACTN|nr:PKD domain-containing protein [Kribbella voronezhensis]TDU84149.1 PKD repeat protein [Kribbella voronezhensis]
MSELVGGRPLFAAGARKARWFAAWLVAVVLVVAMSAMPTRSFAAQAVDEVHYTFTSSTSVSLDWRGDATEVRWGPTSSYGSVAQGSAPAWTPWSSAGPFRQLQLDGLAKGATYHYSIGGGPDWTFHTPPTGNFRFDAIGDVGDSVSFSKLGPTLAAIANDEPSFVLMVGDLTYANATGANIAVIDQHFNDVMNSWGTTAAYMPAWGNHEYDVPGADDLRNYKGRLLMPNAQASPGSPAISCCGDDWGWFDAGSVRFINYPEPWTGAWADWQSKANVLMSQAQNDPSIKYIVTNGHRPAYSTGYHPGEAQLANILDGFGTAYSKYVLNINGHSHDYERFQPIQGVTHITVGSPSSLELPWTSTDPRTAFRAMHLAHLRVDVSDTGLRVQSVCDLSASKEDTTCAQGSVLDEYVIGVPPVTPQKTQYYVDKTVPGCSDTGPGTAATPYCTITKGVGRLQAGYTVYIGDGTYAETIKPAVSGTAAAPITVTAWPGRNPVISAVTNGAYISAKSYFTLSNLTFTGTVTDGIYVTKSDHIVVSGNHVAGSGRPLQSQTAPGISIRATNSSVVSSNTSDHNNGTGIYITNTSTDVLVADNEASYNAEGWQRNANGINVTSPGNTVLRNVTHDNEDSGIQFFTGGNDNLAALNLTYNNGDHGIDDLNVTGGRLISNTVYRNCTSGINVEGTSGSYVIQNNVAVDNAVYPAYNGIACARRAGNIGIWDSAPPTTTVDHNLVWLTKAGTMYVFKTPYTSLPAMQTATGQEAAGVQADPLFFDIPSSDFQLRSGSLAIDRGNSGVSGAQARDILGNDRVRDPSANNSQASGPRLYDDLGAYEYQPDVAPPPAPPTAVLSVTPTTGTTPLLVTANAGGSTDPRGEALSYKFDFGDGTVVGPQSGATADHTFQTAGSFVVKVTATDTSGLSSTATATVTASQPAQPPTARLVASPNTGLTPLTVSADGSSSTDPQAKVLSYEFDFGDGTAKAGPQASSSTSHVYTTAGSYVLSLKVVNSDGLSDTTTTTITTTAPAAPVAKLTVTPTTGTAPLLVAADAGGSTDPQGQALSYSFDFGDGTVVGPQSGMTADHTFQTAGSFVVKVTATDTSGLSSTATATVTASQPAQPPTARLVASPNTGLTPLTVSADGSSSTDPQAKVLSYEFDFGDGTAKAGPQASSSTSHIYTTAGSYVLSLKVVNSDGLSDTTTTTITTTAPIAPVAKLTVTPTTGTAPLPVTANAGTSTDPQGQTLSYSFDFGDGTTVGPQASAIATHTYPTAGTYTVRATVTNTSGLSTVASQTVTVAPAPAYVGQLATASANTLKSSAVLTLTRAANAGDLIVVTARTADSLGAATAKDDAGNTYTLATTRTDAALARITVLSAVATHALAIGAHITVSFPPSTSYLVAADDLVGVKAVDQTVSATGGTAAFSSGPTAITTAPREVAMGVVSLSGGRGAPAWAAGWTTIGATNVSSSYLSRAYRLTTATGTVTAGGTATGTWIAGVVTFKP